MWADLEGSALADLEEGDESVVAPDPEDSARESAHFVGEGETVGALEALPCPC